MTLIETIDKIRELRAEADAQAAGCNYDPQDYIRNRCEELREEATHLENDMHRRVGWI